VFHAISPPIDILTCSKKTRYERSINEEGLDVKMLTLCKEVKGILYFLFGII
jgi:hypothetical protein